MLKKFNAKTPDKTRTEVRGESLMNPNKLRTSVFGKIQGLFDFKKNKMNGNNNEAHEDKNYAVQFFISLIIAVLLGGIIYALTKNANGATISFVFLFVLLLGYFFVKGRLKKYSDIKKMEDAFPDFISLMASNLRAGMTIDKALLYSSRKEFAPLDKEILGLGKDIATGKEIGRALNDMAARIKSDEISRIMKLITSGIVSGGNLSVLLEETSYNMRERIYVRKRAASNVLMYVIFIFFAVAIGAPVLFGLSSVLVEVMTNLLSDIPVEQANINLPFSLTKVNVSVDFIFYFSAFFIVMTDVLASLVLGVVSRGKERDGFVYMVPLILVSLAVFFFSRIFLLKYFSQFFG